MKKCNGPLCNGAMKPLEEFHKGTGTHGRQARCKACANEYQRKWREGNKANTSKKIPSQKTCPGCGLTKPVSMWETAKASSDGLSGYCKTCHCIRKSCRKYNLTRDQLLLIARSVSECMACGVDVAVTGSEAWHSNNEKATGHIDHCHTTGQVRGILCHGCNTAVGHLEENRDYLVGAYRYLQNYSSGYFTKHDVIERPSRWVADKALSNRKHRLKERGCRTDWDEIHTLNQITNCMITGKPLQWVRGSYHEVACIDHCHSQNILRGVLSNQANKAIGHLNDDWARPIHLIGYLTQWPPGRILEVLEGTYQEQTVDISSLLSGVRSWDKHQTVESKLKKARPTKVQKPKVKPGLRQLMLDLVA